MTRGWLDYLSGSTPAMETRACNCIGPQNGDPVCPCMMPEHNRRKMADWALEVFMGKHKPRHRVKCGRRVVA
jgi:hypothetical protein